MKKKFIVFFMAIFITVGMATTAKASPILFDWDFYLDGVLDPAEVGGPGTVPVFDGPGGPVFGTFTQTVTGIGPHGMAAFLDYEDDLLPANIDTAVAVGDLVAGQSWELDDAFFGDLKGDALRATILSNVTDPPITYTGGALPNQDVNVDLGFDTVTDYGMAMAWNFSLLAGETAVVTWTLADSVPSIFYLDQTIAGGTDHVYFSSFLDITDDVGGDPIPEPSTVILLGVGMAGLVATRKRWGKRFIKT